MNKSHFLKLTPCVAAVVLLAACATTNNYQAAINSWQGAPMQQLMAHWGPPMNSFIGPDGNRMFMYYQGGTGGGVQPVSGLSMGFGNGSYPGHGFNSGVGFGTGSAYGSGYGQSGCTTWVEVNKENTIVKLYSKGAGCVASSGDIKGLANPFNPPLQPIS